MAPWDMKNVVAKLARGRQPTACCSTERGTTFGYGLLVNDMRAIPWMQETGGPGDLRRHPQRTDSGALGRPHRRRPARWCRRWPGPPSPPGATGCSSRRTPTPTDAPSDGPNMVPLDRVPAALVESCLRLRAALADAAHGSAFMTFARGDSLSGCSFCRLSPGAGQSGRTEASLRRIGSRKTLGKAVTALRKDSDVGTCRRVLVDLRRRRRARRGPATRHVRGREDHRRNGLGDDRGAKGSRRAAYRPRRGVPDRAAFNLGDVEGTLDAGSRPRWRRPGRPARLACSAGATGSGDDGGALPGVLHPATGQRRGLDRAAVFAALCQQLGLDAVLVGPPAANTWPPAANPSRNRSGPWASATVLR